MWPGRGAVLQESLAIWSSSFNAVHRQPTAVLLTLSLTTYIIFFTRGIFPDWSWYKAAFVFIIKYKYISLKLVNVTILSLSLQKQYRAGLSLRGVIVCGENAGRMHREPGVWDRPGLWLEGSWRQGRYLRNIPGQIGSWGRSASPGSHAPNILFVLVN